ncbi:hypothetical protein FHX82_002892 [Amycolatopsis bartoniae]|nr:hypothetical protein [Amycolatopsis bartoniae]MBB2935838.1 hypothetical protein [Amycolatopsis bartoniae]
MADETMLAITEAVRAGDRERLTALWTPDGDPLHRCTVAHHLADLCEHPAESLAWNVRALDAAGRLTDERLRAHHDGLRVRGFYPSLHLNLAEDYRRLGAIDAARRHLEEARARLDALADDAYGTTVRTGIENVERAIRE